MVIAVLVYVVWQGRSELFRGAFYTRPPSTDSPGSGAAPQIFNTFYLLVLTVIFTVPTGMASGIYFAEYAGTGSLVNAVRRATETLATLPSIVVGLFGYALFVQATGSHPSRLAAALAMTVISLPYAVRITEDALRSLPPTLRESSLALGATRWQTISRVLLPAALGQLVTGRSSSRDASSASSPPSSSPARWAPRPPMATTASTRSCRAIHWRSTCSSFGARWSRGR